MSFLKDLLYVLVLFFVILVALASLNFTDSQYLKSIMLSDTFIGPFAYLFLLFYATPAYFLILFLEKISKIMKLKDASGYISLTKNAISIPLILLSYGYSLLFLKIKGNVDGVKVKNWLSAVFSFFLIISFQLHLFAQVLSLLFISSVLFALIGFMMSIKKN